MHQIIKAVAEVAEGRPDFDYARQDGRTVNHQCSYLHDGVTMKGEGCIVGQALIKTFPGAKEKLEEIEFGGPSPSIRTLSEMMVTDWFKGITEPEVNWLAAVQDGQDNGRTWAQAVAVADDAFGSEVGR